MYTKGDYGSQITKELGPKLYAVSREIVLSHKQRFTEQHRSGQKLSQYTYTPQEIRQIQFCLSIYQGNSKRASITSYPDLPAIDGVMLSGQHLNPEQKIQLETNWFVYALEMHVEFNRFLFEQLERINKWEDRKEVVIHFAEYYHQIRDYYAGDMSAMPMQLCKDYFTTLVNYKIDPNSKVALVAPSDPFQEDSQETKTEVALSDYLLSIEGKMLSVVSEVKIAEYQLKMKILERKLRTLQNGRVRNISEQQLKAYEAMTAVVQTADEALSSLSKTSGEYNAWGNTFLGLRTLVSDKQVEDAFALAEKSVEGLSDADEQYREFAFMLKDAMYDMYTMQWDMLHWKRENFYKRNALNPQSENNNPIAYTPESYSKEADDIALSVMLLGENKFRSTYIQKSSADPEDIISIYVTDPGTGSLMGKEIAMQPDGVSMRNRITKMNPSNPHHRYITAYTNRNPVTALSEEGPVNEYTRSMIEGLDTGGIGALDLSMNTGYDAWFANQLGWNPSQSSAMEFYPKVVTIGKKRFIINIFNLQKELGRDTVDRSEYFRDKNGQKVQRGADGDIVRFNGNMDDFSIRKGDGKYSSLNRNNISDITGNNFNGIIEPKFDGADGRGDLGDFKIYRKVIHEGKSYYFSQCITNTNIQTMGSWRFDREAAIAYIDGYATGKPLFNGIHSSGGRNSEGGYRALEVIPELRSQIQESQSRSLALVRNFPEIGQCASYANTIKEKFGPLRALVEGANSGKMPQSLYELFHDNNGARITEMKNSLIDLRKQFERGGLADKLIGHYKSIMQNNSFGTYVDETEGQILAMLQQLESVQSQLQAGGQLNGLFTRLDQLSPNSFTYWLKTDGLVLIGVIATVIAAMALSGGMASGFTGVLLSGLISGTVGAVAGESFTYGVHSMRSTLDPAGEKVNHEIIKTAAQQGKRQEAIWGRCNQILLTTAMSSGVVGLGKYVINPIKASLSLESSLSSTVLSGVEQLSLHQSASFSGFLRTMLLKGTSRLAGWVPQTIKNLGADASHILGELGSELYEEAIKEELIARLLGDKGIYLMQLLGYVKGKNPSLDPVEHFGMTYHGENANGEVQVQYNSNTIQSLATIFEGEGGSHFQLITDEGQNPGASAYLGNFRVKVRGRDASGLEKDIVYYFQASTSNIKQRTLSSLCDIPDGDITTNERGGLQITASDERKMTILDILRKNHVVSKEVRDELEIYHVIGTDTEYAFSFVSKSSEQVVEYDTQELELFGKDLLGIIRNNYAFSDIFPHGIRENEKIYARMRRVVTEGVLRNQNFASYFPLLTSHIASMTPEQRALFGTYILARGSISHQELSEYKVCGLELEQAHQEKNLLSKAKILRDAGYDEFERLILFKWHVCNSGDIQPADYKSKFNEYMAKISPFAMSPDFINQYAERCNVADRKSDADRNKFVECMFNLQQTLGFNEIMMDIMSKGMLKYEDMYIILKGYNFTMGLSAFYEKLKECYQITGADQASTADYDTRRELMFRYIFSRSSRQSSIPNEANSEGYYYDEKRFSELQQIDDGADSKVYIHPDDPAHVYKVYDRKLSQKHIRDYYQIMNDFNDYLKSRHSELYGKIKFASLEYNIIGSRKLGMGAEQIVQLKRVDGTKVSIGDHDSLSEVDNFNRMLSIFLTGNQNNRYVDTLYNFKLVNGVIEVTDVDRIGNTLYYYYDREDSAHQRVLSDTQTLINKLMNGSNSNVTRGEFLEKTPSENPEIVDYIQNCSDDERIEIAQFILGREISDLEANIILAAHKEEPDSPRPERSDYVSGSVGDVEWKEACDARQLRRLKRKRRIIDSPSEFGISGYGTNLLMFDESGIRKLFERYVCGNPRRISRVNANAALLAAHHPSLVPGDLASTTDIQEAWNVGSVNNFLDELGSVRTTSLKNFLDFCKKREDLLTTNPNEWTINKENLGTLLLFKDEFALFDRFDLPVLDGCNSPEEVYKMIQGSGFAMLRKKRPTDTQLEIASHLFSRAKEHRVGHCSSAARHFDSSIEVRKGVLITDGNTAAYTKSDGDQNTLFMNEHGSRDEFGDLNDIGFTISRTIISEVDAEYDNHHRVDLAKLQNYRRYSEYVASIQYNEKGFLLVTLKNDNAHQVLGSKKVLPMDVLLMNSAEDSIRNTKLYVGMKEFAQEVIGLPDSTLHFKDMSSENISQYYNLISAITNYQDCIDALLRFNEDLVISPPQDQVYVDNFVMGLLRIKESSSISTQSRFDNYQTFLSLLMPIVAKTTSSINPYILSQELIRAGFLGDAVLASHGIDSNGQYLDLGSLGVDVSKIMNDVGLPPQFQHIISKMGISIQKLPGSNNKEVELSLSGNGVHLIFKWKVNNSFDSSSINALFDPKFREGVSNEIKWDYFKSESDYSGYGFIGSTYYHTLFTSLRGHGFKKLTGECMAELDYNGYYSNPVLGILENQGARDTIRNDLQNFIINDNISGRNKDLLQGLVDKYLQTPFDAKSSLLHDLFAIEFKPPLTIESEGDPVTISSGRELRKLPQEKGGLGKTIRGEFIFDLETDALTIQNSGGLTISEKRHREYINDKADIAIASILNLSEQEFDRYINEYIVSSNETMGNTLDIVTKMHAGRIDSDSFNGLNDNPNAPQSLRYAVRIIKAIGNDTIRNKVASAMMQKFFPGLNEEQRLVLSKLIIDTHRMVLTDNDRKLARELGITDLQRLNERKYRHLMNSSDLIGVFLDQPDSGKRFARACMVFGLCAEVLDYNCYGYVYDELANTVGGYTEEMGFASEDDMDTFKGNLRSSAVIDRFDEDWREELDELVEYSGPGIVEISYNERSVHVMLIKSDGKLYHQIGVNGRLEEGVDLETALGSFFAESRPSPRGKRVKVEVYALKGSYIEGIQNGSRSVPEGIGFTAEQTPKACQDIALQARKENQKLSDNLNLAPVIDQIINCSPEKRAEVAAYLLDGYTYPENQSYNGETPVDFSLSVDGQLMTYTTLGSAIQAIHMIYKDASGNLEDDKVNSYKHRSLISLFNSLNNNNQNQSEEISTILLKWNVCNSSVNRIVNLFQKSPDQCITYLRKQALAKNIIGIALRKLVHLVRNPSDLMLFFQFTGSQESKTFTQYQSDALAAHIKLLNDNEAAMGIDANILPYKNIFKACPPSVYILNEMLLKVNTKDGSSGLLYPKEQNQLFRSINRSLDVHETGAESTIPAELDKMTAFISTLSENVIKSKEFQNVIIDCLNAIKTQQPSLLDSPRFRLSFGSLTDAVKERLTKSSSRFDLEVGLQYYDFLHKVVSSLRPGIIVDKINANIIESVYISILMGRDAGFGINVVNNFSEVKLNDISIDRSVSVNKVVAYLQNRVPITDSNGLNKNQQMEYFDFLNQFADIVHTEIGRYFVNVDFNLFQVNFCRLMFGGNRSLAEIQSDFARIDPIKMGSFMQTMRSLYASCNPSGRGSPYDVNNSVNVLNSSGFQAPIDLDMFDRHRKKVMGNHEGKYFGATPTIDHLVYLYTKTKTEGVINNRAMELSKDITTQLNSELSNPTSTISAEHSYRVASFDVKYYPTADVGDREGVINGSKLTGTDGFFVLTVTDKEGKVSKKVCLIDRKLPSGVGNENGCGLTKTITLNKNNISYYPDGLNASTIDHRASVNEYEITISTGSPKNSFISEDILGQPRTSNQNELKELLIQKIINTLL